MDKYRWGWQAACQGSQCQVPARLSYLLQGQANEVLLPFRGWCQERWQELSLLVVRSCHFCLWSLLLSTEMPWDGLWQAGIVCMPAVAPSALHTCPGEGPGQMFLDSEKGKGPSRRTESTELSVWTSTDSVVLNTAPSQPNGVNSTLFHVCDFGCHCYILWEWEE